LKGTWIAIAGIILAVLGSLLSLVIPSVTTPSQPRRAVPPQSWGAPLGSWPSWNAV
jgi:hypothetical protein